MKIIPWTPDVAKTTIKRRFEAAKKHRQQFEEQWQYNYQVINNKGSNQFAQLLAGLNSSAIVVEGDQDQTDSDIGTNYAFKYIRFLHSQMSANPPSVAARAATTDPDDRRRADAADRIIRHGIKHYDINEIVDQTTLKTLIYGTSWLKLLWNKDKGEESQFNEETKELIMSGDIDLYCPDITNIWIDPDCKVLKDVRYVFERKIMTQEEALFLYPKSEDAIKSVAANKQKSEFWGSKNEEEAAEPQIEIYEYYEKAAPVNGMSGRFVRFLSDYTLLEPPTKNPHFAGLLPYHGLTYIDVPDQVFGKSVVEYVADLQDMLNRIDSSIVDNVQAHGVIRLLVPDDAEINEGKISSTAWDWIRYSGNKVPTYMPAPAVMPDMWSARNQMQTSIQELFGINDSQLGIQKREQSAVSQQTAIEQGTLIHRRLFKKYAMMIEAMFKSYLGLIQEHWNEKRTIMVLGKENAFETREFKGADIASGYDLSVDYGQSLPLDPNLRRESIMLMSTTLKEAGMSAKQILQYLKINDLEGLQDRPQLSANRQREVFEEMIAMLNQGVPPEDAYLPPEELEDHAARLEFAYTYLETVDFKYLSDVAKDIIRMHVKEREQLLAKAANPLPAPNPNILPVGMPGVEGSMAPNILSTAGVI